MSRWLKDHQRWFASIALLIVGGAIVISAKHEDGWSQAWRVEVGAAVALLGPLYFLEQLLRDSLMRVLEDSTRSYGLIRRLLRPGDERTAILDRFLAAVTDEARRGTFPADEISRLARGDSESRTVALAAMRGDHGLVDEDALVFSIALSGSGMEQYHALRVAHDAWERLSRSTQERVVRAIETDASARKYIAGDTARERVAGAILERAGEDGVTAPG